MPIHWTLTLLCSACGAAIRFEDERPDWKEDAALLAEIAAAERWAAEHPKADHRTARPRLVAIVSVFGHTAAQHPETRYVACPACGGKAYMGSGGPPAA